MHGCIFLLFSIWYSIGTAEKTILRPNLYFGTRSPTETSHLSGLLWFEGSRLNSVRHECKHEDDIKRWGWTEFDTQGYGKQKLVDVHNFVKLDMDYLQQDNNWVLQIEGTPAKKGKQVHNVTMIFYYGVSGNESKIQPPSLSKKEQQQGTEGIPLIPFYSEDVGYGHIRIEEDPSNNSPKNLNTPFSTLHFKPSSESQSLDHAFWFGKRIERPQEGWRFGSMIQNQLEQGINKLYGNWQNLLAQYRSSHPNQGIPDSTRNQLNQPIQPLLPNTIEKNSNFIAVQRVFSLPFSITIFVTREDNQSNHSVWNKLANSIFSKLSSHVQSIFETMTIEERVNLVQHKSAAFDTLFKSKFNLSAFPDKYQVAAKAAVSNLLGGISYFVGDTVQMGVDGSIQKTQKGELLTAVPGRSFFPRGFIWDEGFHQLVIREWNSTLSEVILRSWLDRIESSGYLEREQILGEEARSRVPDQFVAQNPNIVNPPTFVLVFEKIANELLQKNQEVQSVSDQESQYDNQSVSDQENQHDNQSVSDQENQHDNQSVSNQENQHDNQSVSDQENQHNQHAKELLQNQHEIQITEDGEIFPATSSEYQFLEESLPKLWKWIQYISKTQKSQLEHGLRWFGRTQSHCLASGLDDTPRHTIVSEKESHVDLVAWMTYAYKVFSNVEKRLHGETPFYQKTNSLYQEMRERLRSTYWDDTSKCFGDRGVVELEGKEVIGFEPHLSYISILPFSLMLLDEEDPAISSILDAIEDPERLWSNHGIRSLSKQDPYFGTEENYWRGKVWINMNYLLLKALYTKYNKAGYEMMRCQEIYSKLRTNLIDTIVKEYYASGFFWENYDSETGKGTGVHPFTGWTTLFVLIMAEQYN